MAKQAKLRKRSKNTLPALHNKAWTLQSFYTRLRDKCTCITCCQKRDMSEMQAGHFIHGNSFDFIEENINCQCVACNHFRRGDLGNYAIKLDEKYGKGTAEKLISIRHDIRKFTRSELESIIEQLKEKIERINQ